MKVSSPSVEKHWYFSSESVTEGHPDKVADAISDAILDAVLEREPTARVACETLVTENLVIVSGETSVEAGSIETIARGVIRDIGYTEIEGFRADHVGIEILVHRQSPDIAVGVARNPGAWDGERYLDLDALGAGDQGIMFGFACDETPALMPLPIQLAHRLAERLTEVRKDGTLDYLRPDGKTQVTVEYEGHRPVRVPNVLVSAHHAPNMDQDVLAKEIEAFVIEPVLAGFPEAAGEPAILVNPTGRFERGGPAADTGLTGRKIIVDTYGGYSRHGGGAFSGKDPTKVDRSATYAARHAAKNLVAAGLATKTEIQLAYAIGRPDPFSIHVETFGTETISPESIDRVVREVFDFRPAAIINRLGLCKPMYRATSAYGHFGRPGFPWEALDMVDALKAAAH